MVQVGEEEMQFVLRVVCRKTGVRVHNPGCFDTPRSELGSNSARNNTQDFADGAVRRSNLLVIEELKDLLETRLRDRTGREVLIRDLVAMIARLTGFEGEVRWQKSKPDGQPRRQLDVTRAFEKFGFRAQTSLEEGLRRTIEWYEAERD